MIPPLSMIKFEFSAGGVVREKGKILLIKANGVWTFPKGHIERGENSEIAALREVLEETGYSCRIDRKLDETQYLFFRKKSLVIKKVKWFKMTVIKNKVVAACENYEKKWADYDFCSKHLKYASDLKLIDEKNMVG